MKCLLAALACCSLVPLAACSQDSSSTSDPGLPTPTAATSSAASPSPTSRPSEVGETPEEFVRRWVDVDREMENTGETAEYRQLSRGCRPCQELADQIDAIYSKGGFVKTAGWTVLRLRVSHGDRANAVVVRALIDAAPTEYVERQGGPVLHLPGGQQTQLVTLSPVGATWRVTDVEQVAK